MLELLSAGLGALLMALAIGLIWVTKPWRLFGRAARRKSIQRQVKNALRNVGESATAAEEATKLIRQLQRDAETQRRRADEYFTKIKTMESERDHWQSLYYQVSVEHGNAQELLLAERRENARRMLAAGKQPYADPRVEAAVQAFSDEHSVPARKAAVEAVNSIRLRKDQADDSDNGSAPLPEPAT